MNTPSKNDPLALEAATLALARSNGSAMQALLEALSAERDKTIDRLVSANVIYPHATSETKGAAWALRDLVDRMSNAEDRLANYQHAMAKLAARKPSP